MQNGCHKSGKLTSGYEMANKPEIKKEQKERMVEKKRKREKNKTTLSEKKEEARNVSEQSVIRVHDTIHSADNNTAGQQTLTNYPPQRKNERFVEHRDYTPPPPPPPHSYIVNERYNSRNKRTSQEKKQ